MIIILSSLHRTVSVGFVLAAFLLAGWISFYGGEMDREGMSFLLRYSHVLSGIMWVGLLWYFNFVQIPSMPAIPDEHKPAVSKVIAPAALFWFRWSALATLITGILLAMVNGYFIEAALLGAGEGFSVGKHVMIGIGMWLGAIMAFNVWFVIWPQQKKALGIVPAESAERAAAARNAMLFSRANTLLSIPMLLAMTSAQNLF